MTKVWLLIVAATVGIVGFATGLYYKSTDSRAFLSFLSLSVGFLVGVSLEPVKFYFWRQQERWKFAREVYADLLSSLDETEARTAAAHRMLGVMPVDTVMKMQGEAAAAMQRLREAAGKARVLGDEVAQAFDQFQASVRADQDACWRASVASNKEMQEIAVSVQTHVAAIEGLSKLRNEHIARFESKGLEEEALRVALNMNTDIEGHQAEIHKLSERQRVVMAAMSPLLAKANDAFVGAVAPLRATLTQHARRLLGEPRLRNKGSVPD